MAAARGVAPGVGRVFHGSRHPRRKDRGVAAVVSDRTVAWTLVGFQIVLLVGLVLVPTGDDWPQLATAVIALVGTGAGLGLWAIAVFGRGVTPSPLPAASASMVTRGPYRWIRHPMYTAVVIFSAGVVIRSRNAFGVAMLVALVGFFALKARWEERRLVARYPGYAAYATRTGRFVPGVGRLDEPGR